jgi:hypothetical protein
MVNDFLMSDLFCIDLEMCKVVLVGGRVGWGRAGVDSNPTFVDAFCFSDSLLFTTDENAFIFCTAFVLFFAITVS